MTDHSLPVHAGEPNAREGEAQARTQSVAPGEGAHPPQCGELGCTSGSPFLSPIEVMLEDDALLGFVAGFAIVHESCNWALVQVGQTSVSYCWCYNCRESRVYDPTIASMLQPEIPERR